MASITLEELHLFHAVDREIFSRLVINLGRDPAQALWVMALWLWFEETNFPSIILKMTSLPDAIVNQLAEEATSCLISLDSKTTPTPSDGGMPITSKTTRKPISLQTFYQNRLTMISGIKTFLNKVCAVIFTDILQQVVLSGTSRTISTHQPFIVTGFLHPTFGSVAIFPQPLDYNFLTGGLWGWSPTIEVPVDDRTMFLTFSRGYPVTEAEVRELFTTKFGDCVESVRMMPASPSSKQSLYARMVVRSVSTIDQILSRGPIAKFKIGGKHVWARKYERRENSETA